MLLIHQENKDKIDSLKQLAYENQGVNNVREKLLTREKLTTTK
jgi:hypothetical protein